MNSAFCAKNPLLGETNQKVSRCWGGRSRKLGTQMKMRTRLGHSGTWNMARETHGESESTEGVLLKRGKTEGVQLNRKAKA